jgi:mRNA interferase MazF
MPYMTTYKIGDIVLIGFPHSDLKHIAKRPAIVLFDAGDEDILVARITTQGYTTRTDYMVQNWRGCGLMADSYIRLGKQATLEKRLVIRHLGTLEEPEIDQVRLILQKMFIP